MEYDYVASGHYAKVVHAYTDQRDKPSVLELSKDMVFVFPGTQSETPVKLMLIT